MNYLLLCTKLGQKVRSCIVVAPNMELFRNTVTVTCSELTLWCPVYTWNLSQKRFTAWSCSDVNRITISVSLIET